MKKILLSVIIFFLFFISSDFTFCNKKEIWKVQSDFALSLYKEKKYQKALEIEKSSLEIAEKTFGKNHPNYVSNLNNIGEIYRALKNVEKAEEFFKKAVLIERNRKGGGNAVSVRYISNLALLYEAESKYEKAEKFQAIAVEYGEKFFGKKSSEYSALLSRLGRIYRKLEKFKKAGPVLKKALDINLENRDPDNKNNVLIYSNLGMNFESSGDFDKAEYYLKKAVLLSRSVFGENASETARNINNLSALYFKFSKYKEARELTEKFLKLNRRQKVSDNQMISTGVSNLAAVFYAQKLYNNAEKTFLGLLKDQETQFGNGHPVVAATLRNLGILYFSWKKYEKSRIFLERSFVIEPVPGTFRGTNFFEGRSTLGLTYEKLGLKSNALKLYKRSLELKVNSLESDSYQLVPALNDLAIYFFKTGKDIFLVSGRAGSMNFPAMAASVSFINESGKFLIRGMKIVDKFPDKTYPDSLTTVNYYMEYLFSIGKFEETEDLYLKIVKRYREVYGESHLNMTNVLRQFAGFYKKVGNLEKALKINRLVIDIFKKNDLGNDLKIVESLRDLADLLVLQRGFDEALEVFLKKLRIMEKKFGSDSLEVANDVYEIGNVNMLIGNQKEAGKNYLRVLNLWDSNGEGEGINSVPFLQDISEKLLKSGYKKQWRRLNTRIRRILRKEARNKVLNK